MTDERVDVSERGRSHTIIRHRARIILAAMAETTAATTATTPQPHARRGPEPPDIEEKGGMKEGKPQKLNQRLFMQFLAFGGCINTHAVAKALADAGIAGVVYEDVNDPRGVALLTFSEDPARSRVSTSGRASCTPASARATQTVPCSVSGGLDPGSDLDPH